MLKNVWIRMLSFIKIIHTDIVFERQVDWLSIFFQLLEFSTFDTIHKSNTKTRTPTAQANYEGHPRRRFDPKNSLMVAYDFGKRSGNDENIDEGKK